MHTAVTAEQIRDTWNAWARENRDKMRATQPRAWKNQRQQAQEAGADPVWVQHHEAFLEYWLERLPDGQRIQFSKWIGRTADDSELWLVCWATGPGQFAREYRDWRKSKRRADHPLRQAIRGTDQEPPGWRQFAAPQDRERDWVDLDPHEQNRLAATEVLVTLDGQYHDGGQWTRFRNSGKRYSLWEARSIQDLAPAQNIQIQATRTDA